jgi:hypothetical protein
MRDTLALALIRAELCRAYSDAFDRSATRRPKAVTRASIAKAIRSIRTMSRRLPGRHADLQHQRLAAAESCSPPD